MLGRQAEAISTSASTSARVNTRGLPVRTLVAEMNSRTPFGSRRSTAVSSWSAITRRSGLYSTGKGLNW